eukprot:1145004-Alexandrium_andersonii.AAC.1
MASCSGRMLSSWDRGDEWLEHGQRGQEATDISSARVLTHERAVATACARVCTADGCPARAQGAAARM